MIHRYRYEDLWIVLDVESGAVHLVDELAYEMLGHLTPPLQQEPPQTLLERLSSWPREEVLEAYRELYHLWEQGELFAGDGHDAFVHKLGLAPVKAMCLNVSHDCNLRCTYCFAGKGDYNQGRMTMDAKTGKQAIDYLIAASGDRERLEVDFFGGEPLLAFDTVKEVVEYARSREGETGKRFRFTITTNGMLLDDDKIDYINREMSNVVLSLDGRKSVNDKVRARVDGSGCYETVVPKFQKLVQRRGDGEYYLRGTFTKYNKDFGQDVLAMFDLGFDQVSVEPVVSDPKEPWALTREDLPEVFAEYDRLATTVLDHRLKKTGLNFFHFMLDLSQGPCAIKRLRGCGCGNEYLAVTPDGDVYPCHQFVGMDQWKMGNVFDGTLDQDKKAYFAASTVYEKPDCLECWAKFYCSGGCNANNFRYEGDVRKAHTLSCEMERKRLECAIGIKAAQLLREEEVMA